MRFELFIFCQFFLIFMQLPHTSWQSEPYIIACHIYTCQCLNLSYVSFFTLKFIAQSLQCVHVNKAYYKFKFHLKFIGLYFVKSSMAKFLLKKKNSVELGKILMFVQILWKSKVVCYKDIKTNSMRFNVSWSVLLN